MAGVSETRGVYVIGKLRSLANAVLGVFVAKRIRISVGPNSRIRWWALRGSGTGRIVVGAGSMLRCRISFDHAGGEVKIGDRCFLGASHLVCHTGITIGDDVIMSWGVTVVDHDSHALAWKDRSRDISDWMQGVKHWDKVVVSAVTINDKVWIGFGVSILKGVTVGEGAVIGANAVVTKSVPPYCVVAGNPARIVKRLGNEGEPS